MKTQPNTLVGHYFHSVDPGRVDPISGQGQVIGNPEPGLYLVEIFSWVSGAVCCRSIFRTEQMMDWIFYETQEDMKHSFKDGIVSGLRRVQTEK